MVLLHDTRCALRALLKRPTAACAIVVTLSVSLGMNAAAFAVLDALVIRPLSVASMDDLVLLSEVRRDGRMREPTSAANFADWKARTRTIAELSAFATRPVEIGSDDDPERLQGAFVSSNLFQITGMRPALGRAFTAEEETFGRHRSLILSHGLWRRRFAGDSAILGRAVVLDGVSHQVVGVGPQTGEFPPGAELWAPLAIDSATATDRDVRTLSVIGRLRPGSTVVAAQAEMTAVAADLARQFPANAERNIRVETFLAGMRDEGMGPVLALTQAAAFIVLLIACVNITSLLLAIGLERQREVAMRYALGATRPQIVRGFWVESALLGLVTVPLALIVAMVGLDALTASMPARVARLLPGWQTIDIDGRLVLFTTGLAVVAATIFGLVPALQTSRPNIMALREASAGATAGAGRQRLRRALIVAQVALVLPLVVAAALSWRGTARFLNGPQGYDPAGVITARVALPERQYPDRAAQQQFVTALLDRFRATRGLAHAAIANVLPSTGMNPVRRIEIEGRPAERGVPNAVDYRSVSATYFTAMRIPIVTGRGFTDADRDGAPPVAIVSRSMAARYWPRADAVGRRFRPAAPPNGEWITVVGIADDVIHDWFFGRNAPTMYRPYTQDPVRFFSIAARSGAGPAEAVSQIREALRGVDATRPLFDVMPMEQIISDRLVGLRQTSAVLAALGGLSLLLAAVGMYGLIAYLVSQRTAEIGLRLALGATRGDTLRLVLKQASRLTLTGVLIGGVIALAVVRVLESALVGIATMDGTLLLLAVIVVAVIGLLAGYVPARRALAIEPSVALRNA